MIIKDVLNELEIKEHPVAKALYKKEGFKVLVLAFKKDMKPKNKTYNNF